MPSIVHSIQTQLSQRGNNLHNNIRHVTQNLPQFIEVRVRYRHSARQRASSMLRSFSPGNLPSKLTRQVLQKYFPELEKLPFGEGKSTLLESALKMGGLEGTEAQTAIKALRIANNPLGFLKNALSPSFKAGFSKISGFLSKGMSSIAQKLAPVISKISATIRPMLVKAGQLLVQAATWISEVAIPALIASAEVWVPILVVVVVIGVVVFVIYVHVRRTKFESAQIVPVAGVGGQGEEGVPVDYTPYEGELEIIPIAGACWPVGGYITQEDGSAHATMPGASAFDIGGNDGATVVTPFAGTVLAAGWSNQGYGLYVMLAASGTRTDTGETVSFTLIFAHFGELKIPPCDPSKPDQPEYQTGCGQSLSAGTVLGTVDNTGNSTGPHLHYESKGVAIRSIVPDGANVKLDDAVSGCGS